LLEVAHVLGGEKLTDMGPKSGTLKPLARRGLSKKGARRISSMRKKSAQSGHRSEDERESRLTGKEKKKARSGGVISNKESKDVQPRTSELGPAKDSCRILGGGEKEESGKPLLGCRMKKKELDVIGEEPGQK